MGRVLIGLAGAIFFLMCVGIESGTPVRHAIQALPAAVVLICAQRRVPGSAFGAIPFAVLWGAIMVSIWLFLLGLPHLPFTHGHFTTFERFMTVGILVSVLIALLGFKGMRTSRAAAAAWIAGSAALSAGAIVVTLATPLGRM